MSVTAFNRRRREMAALEEARRLEEEASKIMDASEPTEEAEANEEVEPTEEKVDYSKLKVDELKEIAKEKGIEGCQDLKKAELIEAIEKA